MALRQHAADYRQLSRLRIVASYYDRSIAQHVLVVVGIGMAGTKAAAEFVTSNEELQGWLNGVKPASGSTHEPR